MPLDSWSLSIQVVEAMCELMLTMTEAEELAAELASYPVVALLQKAIADFPCIEDIVQVYEIAVGNAGLQFIMLISCYNVF